MDLLSISGIIGDNTMDDKLKQTQNYVKFTYYRSKLLVLELFVWTNSIKIPNVYTALGTSILYSPMSSSSMVERKRLINFRCQKLISMSQFDSFCKWELLIGKFIHCYNQPMVIQWNHTKFLSQWIKETYLWKPTR